MPTIVGFCPQSQSVTSPYHCCRSYTSYTWRLCSNCQAPSPILQYKPNYLWHNTLRSYCIIHHVFSMFTWSQMSFSVHCMSWIRLTTSFIIVTNSTAENHVTPFDSDMYLEYQITQNIHCVTCLNYFLKRNHMFSMCMKYFIPCIHCTDNYRAAVVASIEVLYWHHYMCVSHKMCSPLNSAIFSNSNTT